MVCDWLITTRAGQENSALSCIGYKDQNACKLQSMHSELICKTNSDADIQYKYCCIAWAYVYVGKVFYASSTPCGISQIYHNQLLFIFYECISVVTVVTSAQKRTNRIKLCTTLAYFVGAGMKYI